MSDADQDQRRLPRSRPWLRLLLMSVIFLSGMVVGVGGTLIFIRQQVQQRIHHPETAPARVAARMKWMLGLDDQQTAEVEQIIRERQRAIQGIRRDFQPQLEEELDLLGEEVSAVLNTQQQAEWQQKYGEMRERWIPRLPPVGEEKTEEAAE